MKENPTHPGKKGKLKTNILHTLGVKIRHRNFKQCGSRFITVAHKGHAANKKRTLQTKNEHCMKKEHIMRAHLSKGTNQRNIEIRANFRTALKMFRQRFATLVKFIAERERA